MAKRLFNIDKMPLVQLVKLRAQIERSIDRKIVQERKGLQLKIDALSGMERSGSKANHPTRRRTNGIKSHPLTGRKAKVKYRGPKGETWAGRGLLPRWLTALEKKGKKREQFLIARPS